MKRNIDTKSKPVNWRSQATHDSYMAAIEAGDLDDGCRLCSKELLVPFTYWKIIDNKYPYDRVADVHHMIIPLRHTDGSDLTSEELRELAELKQTYLNETYHFIVEALPRTKSIPGHLHLHLIVPKQP